MAITAKEIRIDGLNQAYELLEFGFQIEPGTHGHAYLKLRLQEWMDIFEDFPYGTTLCISTSLDETNIDILFQGMVVNPEIERKDQYYELSLWLQTASSLLDRESRLRSFQDVNITYGQLLEVVLQDTEHAGVILTVEDRQIPHMMMQYMESDWDFVKRLSSHFTTTLIPDWKTGTPKFFFGTEVQGKEIAMPVHDYITIVDNRFYEEGGNQEGFLKSDFLYYEVVSDQNYDIGDYMTLHGKVRCILKKHVVFKQGMLEFTYSFGTAYPVRRTGNNKLIGAAISGVVLETKDELVKIHLDTDVLMPTCMHPWTPTTGNHFYCMPETETRVTLYFGNHTENCAKSLENIRENGESCPKTQEYENRYFGSQQGKELAVLPESPTLGPRDALSKIRIEDASGISFVDKTFSIKAKGQVMFEGEQIYVTAPSQVSMIRDGKGLPCTFNICQDFNALGVMGSMEGTGRSIPRIQKPTEDIQLEDAEVIDFTALSCLMTGGLEDSENEMSPQYVMSGTSLKAEMHVAADFDAASFLEKTKGLNKEISASVLSMLPRGKWEGLHE